MRHENRHERYRDELQRVQRREWDDSKKHRSVTPEKLRRLRGICSDRRSYKSVDWIQNIIDDNPTGRGVKARIYGNLHRKQPLLDVMRCLITDAMLYRDGERFTRNHGMGKVTMRAKVERKWADRDRIPIMVKVDVPSIAERLQVSEILIRKYLKAMEQAGLIQRPANVKKYSSTMGSYRIIGGYVVHLKLEEEQPPLVTPVYFWARSQPEIGERLARFSLGR